MGFMNRVGLKSNKTLVGYSLKVYIIIALAYFHARQMQIVDQWFCGCIGVYISFWGAYRVSFCVIDT